jgi:hypothetical protein
MRTLATPPHARPWRRDVRLLVQIARMLFGYAVAGGRVRRRYRALEARGGTLWLDEEGPHEHREAALRR